MRIAVLVKQIPVVDDMALDPQGRLVRSGTDLEMSAYCRRAVSKAVELAAGGGSVTVLTLGPHSAEDVLREALAWGRDRGADIRGVLITDPAFAGSDTIATARALCAAVSLLGPFDLIVTGKNSLDADTGQVPPQLAELLDLPFAAGVKRLEIDGRTLRLGCEHDDSWVDLQLSMPAVLSCAERLCDPAKVPAPQRADVPAELITTLTASDLGPGPWGTSGSLTTVGECRAIAVDRARKVCPDEPVSIQVRDVVRELVDRGVLARQRNTRAQRPLPSTGGHGPVVAVLAEPNHDAMTRDLCGLAAGLANGLDGSTVLLSAHAITAADAGAWGADRLVRLLGCDVAEDVAMGTTSWLWSAPSKPWAVLVGSTTWGREVASRVAAAVGAGLTGDAADLDLVDGRLVAWKPAFGGQLLAAVTATSPLQMVTMRAGMSAPFAPRDHVAAESVFGGQPRGRVRVLHHRSQDSLKSLADADVVIGIGRGVPTDEMHLLDELRDLLGAEIGCTRKLTDVGAMPHARQIGVTGRAISPSLYVAVGTSGRFNHMIGVRSAGTVLAINPDADAPVFQHADLGVVATFQECVPLLVKELREQLR